MPLALLPIWPALKAHGMQRACYPWEVVFISYCYSKQVARHEKSNGGQGPGARWQETIHLVNSGGPWADRGKQETSDRRETTHFGW